MVMRHHCGEGAVGLATSWRVRAGTEPVALLVRKSEARRGNLVGQGVSAANASSADAAPEGRLWHPAPGESTMTDTPNRPDGLIAKLLAMKDLPLAPDPERSVPNHPLRLSSAQIDAVRTALLAEVCEWLEHRSLATKPLDAMTQDELDEVRDAAFSALMNAAPIVRSYTARQDKGSYPVWITGIDGVYVLMASEHDTLGPFGTLVHAVDAMDRSYGKFLVGD